MTLATQLTGLKNPTRPLTLGERVELSCRLAKQYEKAGEYDAARQALSEFWPERDGPVKLDGLDEPAMAQVLLRTGALAGWLGSADQITGSQESAKNLITRSIEIFEALGQAQRVAEARSDLALCYWREGGFDEARINLADALAGLSDQDGDLKASVLIRAGMVEATAGRTNEALRFYEAAATWVEQSADPALKGTFHNSLATLLTRLATTEDRQDYADRALIEYAAASFHFEHAENHRYLARVENNLGNLFLNIGRYKDAHHHLNRARDLFRELKDIGTAAQVDETRARTLLAEGRMVEAERVVRSAVRTLERGGEQALLAEALTTHGVALARLGRHNRSRVLLERAVEVAQTAGDPEGAGQAQLALLEELGGRISVGEIISTYRSAVDLLKGSQTPSSAKRLLSCLDILLAALEASDDKDLKSPAHAWDGFSFKQRMHEDERAVIEQALRDAGGSVTRAARLLGFKHHQSLISLINGRHQELLKTRSTVFKRRHHLVSEVGQTKKLRRDGSRLHVATQTSVLHVAGKGPVARSIADTLVADGIKVDTCASGTAALKILRSNARYDAIVVHDDLTGVGGLELVRQARSMARWRHTRIIVLAGEDCEKEAWRAGADAFLPKPGDIEKVAMTIARLMNKPSDG